MLSFESPRTSFSSSTCSSNYSSADCTKPSRADRHRSPDFVKSRSRGYPMINHCGLSVKTRTKVDAGQHQILRYIDSPRPLQSLKPAMARNISLNKLSHDFSKLREVHRTADGCKDGSLAFMPRDAHRFSYDERRSHNGVKVKLKDQPRLSLDSRQISIKVSTNDAKSKFLLGELNTRSQQQEPGSRKGPSSVVTKLIGLKTLPDPMQIHGNQRFRIKTSQNSKKESISPHSINADSKKPVATICPNEPDPWKHIDGSRDQTSTLKCSRETPRITQNASLTVYGEIEKRPNSPKDPSSRLQSRDKMTSRTSRFNQTSKELPPIAQQNPKLATSSETACLELQKKKLESENQPHRTCPTSDQSINRRQSSRLQTEPGLTHWKSRHKPHNLQGYANTSAATYDIEATRTDRSYKMGTPVSQKQEKNHKIETTEPPSTVMEQPSLVSVLDATFNGDESPSPVKKKSNAFKDYGGLIADESDLNNKQLILKAVNEILTRMNENSCKPWVSPTDSLQSIILRYLTIGSMSWTNCKREIPGVILDVERLIFKDLIGEVIRGEAEHPQG
ncbi:hypothetical protein F3Y22_tig00112523pilonHSYRG00300 [Hibiscus syriacus]|uniref:DUF4378 domain-containing protein n=1 Tax=Hibiscus syriacus TaxID=106335 RepID=A0A6A2XFR0_HIBSY|nr:hypothetical protein F3Y22_tig00112523pilonHSYRG00300 [Hibiscus syriacus]